MKVTQCGGLCINMKEKFKLYFVFYGDKLRKVNLINAIVRRVVLKSI